MKPISGFFVLSGYEKRKASKKTHLSDRLTSSLKMGVNMRISITGKICFILLIVFSLVIISTTVYQAVRERELVVTLSTDHVKNQVESLRLGVDLMVKNQHPEELNQLLKEFAKQPHVTSLKWVMNPTTELFGEQTTENKPATDEEVSALKGHEVQRLARDSGKNELVVITPYYLKDQQQPIAAIHLVYNIDQQLELVEKHIFFSAIMLSFIFSGVVLMTLIITKKHIVEPLQKLREAMEDITDFDDLSKRLPVQYNDEIDQLNASFNDLADYIVQQRNEQKAP